MSITTPPWLGTIRTATDYDVLRATAMAEARSIARSDGATFVLRDGECCFYVDEDAISPLWRGQRFPLQQCISGWAMLNHETALVPRPFEDDRIPHDAYRPTFIQSLVIMPMGSAGAPSVGAIGVYWATPARTLDPPAMAAMTTLVDEVGRAVVRLGVHRAPWAPNFAIGSTSPPVAAP